MKPSNESSRSFHLCLRLLPDNKVAQSSTNEPLVSNCDEAVTARKVGFEAAQERSVKITAGETTIIAPKAPDLVDGDSPENVWLQNLRKNPPILLTEKELRKVCQRVKAILIEENNVISVSCPVTVCGDIHGQFYDLLELFNVGGNLGDYVDRGYNSVETLQYLLILKLCHPSQLFLLRGNHESRQITQIYGFYDECMRKYGNANSWRYCTDLFDYMSLAADDLHQIIDGDTFCVHGGLSPCIKLIDQLRLIDRVQEIPHDGPFGDIVWSDPEYVDGWAVNPRGAGWLFGSRIVDEFNQLNKIGMIARAHQLAMDGYRFMFPSSTLITIWSAPNYCYRCGNLAGILRMHDSLNSSIVLFRDTEMSKRSSVGRVSVPYFM